MGGRSRVVRLLRQRPASEWLLVGTLSVYLLACLWIYFAYVQPWIAGITEIRIGADSDHYWEVIRQMSTGGSTNLVSLTGNFLGPVLLGATLKTGFAVMCFNVLVFGLAMKVAASIPQLNKALFGFLMLANAELLPALTTLNKEIFALLASVLIAKYFYSDRPSKLLLLFAVVASIAARWEQAMILLLFIAIRHSPLRTRPKLTLALLIGLITVTYPVAFRVLGVDPEIFAGILENGNLIVKLNSIQSAYGFPVVVLPKMLMTVAGKLAKPSYLLQGEFLQGDFADPQQDIFQPLGCAAFLIVLAWCAFKRRLTLRKPLIVLSAITMIITAVTPFIQPRYTYGTYVWLCVELAVPACLGLTTNAGPAAIGTPLVDPSSA